MESASVILNRRADAALLYMGSVCNKLRKKIAPYVKID